MSNGRHRNLIRKMVSLDPNDYEAFERLAKRNGMSTAMLIRLAMKKFLEGAPADQALLISLEPVTQKVGRS